MLLSHHKFHITAISIQTTEWEWKIHNIAAPLHILSISLPFRRRASCPQHDAIPTKKIQENLSKMDPRECIQEIPR